MKNVTFTILISVLLYNMSIAQMNKFPNGVYLNLEQFQNQTPAFDANLRIIKRSSGDITMMGGNDYKLESNIDSIDKKYIKKTIYAYVKGDSILLNCALHKLQTGYALAATAGTFIAFKACMTNGEATNVAILGGLIGGALAAGKRYLNVLSLRTGNVRSLTKEYLAERLKDKQTILDQFNSEFDQESEKTLIKYVNLLNQVTAPGVMLPK